mmetsp:Transcript_38760/g.66182  ORF Transcript_38760/g.66182 Transcript_38760/m.66182 type:complete len:89 (-) Transcript_38760:30-296(-)
MKTSTMENNWRQYLERCGKQRYPWVTSNAARVTGLALIILALAVKFERAAVPSPQRHCQTLGQSSNEEGINDGVEDGTMMDEKENTQQ